MSELPIQVSVCCLAYNHAGYIRECLEGFICQKTNFAFEVLIHDDASTDDTQNIIREYEAKYPEIIKPIYQTENRYQRGLPVQKLNYERARGKYIALCEGDDCWIDDNKLQKQYDFMETHPNYSMCFHRAKCWNVDANSEEHIFDHIEERDYTGTELLLNWTVPTASAFCRAEYVKEIPYDRDFWAGDIVIWLTMCHFGKVRALASVMSLYRVSNSGAVLQMHTNFTEEKLQKHLRHLNALYRYFPFLPKSFQKNRMLYYTFLRILYVKDREGRSAALKRVRRESLWMQIKIILYYLKFRLTH